MNKRMIPGRGMKLLLLSLFLLGLLGCFVPSKGGKAAGPVPAVVYRTHLESYGWQGWVRSGGTSGSVGQAKRMEALEIRLENAPYSGSIQYTTHVQSFGWMNWKENGDTSGTTGKAKRLEAVRIRLTGEMAEHYDIYYRVHAQTYGWMSWAKNGAYAGTAGQSKRLEAIQILLVEKEEEVSPSRLDSLAAGISGQKRTDTTAYSVEPPTLLSDVHPSSIGWQGWKRNGELSGRESETNQIEALRLLMEGVPCEGGIEYQAHVQSFGWMDWQGTGTIAGTTGKRKRVEAIRVCLTGEMADYFDVYYRVLVEGAGWTGWSRNGEEAGTTGQAKRLFGLQVTLKKKGEEAPGTLFQGINSEKPPRDNSKTLDRILGGTGFVEAYLEKEGSSYLGIPYAANYSESYYAANGYYKTLQCTAFLNAVMRSIGCDPSRIPAAVGGGQYNASAWIRYVKMKAAAGQLEMYSYASVMALLKDGHAEKGDMILFESTATLMTRDRYGNYNDNHMGIFWGESSGDDKMWHSACAVKGISKMLFVGTDSGNQISTIAPVSAGCKVYLIKTAH